MSWLIRKETDAGKDWRQEKETTEDEMVGYHHWLNWHEFEQALEDGKRQGSLVCCSPWSRTQLSNWTDLKAKPYSGDAVHRAETSEDTRERVAFYKPRREDSEDTKLMDTLILNSQPQYCQKIHFCCLSHQFVVTLLCVHAAKSLL